MAVSPVRVQIRPYRPAVDCPWVEELWAAAMPPVWPVPRADIAALTDGLVAESGAGPVGFAAVDRAGSIPLILVQPRAQRRRVGTRLLAEASHVLRTAAVTRVQAASGGTSYIWPGCRTTFPALSLSSPPAAGR
jgi:GNAT superfamily N-acetyltransferase